MIARFNCSSSYENGLKHSEQRSALMILPEIGSEDEENNNRNNLEVRICKFRTRFRKRVYVDLHPIIIYPKNHKVYKGKCSPIAELCEPH